MVNQMDQKIKDVQEILSAGTRSARPDVLFPSLIQNPPHKELREWIESPGRYLLCLGKAALESARVILQHVSCAQHFVLAPRGGTREYKDLNVHWGTHPIPDEHSFESTRGLIRWIRSLPEDGRLLVILSGGTSALLVCPVSGVSPESKMRMNDLLLRSGASIQQINTVRKHLSAVKGGQLGRMVPSSGCLVLVLSDVIGNDLAAIASGPFYPDPTTFADARGVLDQYRLWEEVPEDVRKTIESGLRGEIPETPKPQSFELPHYIVGSNDLAKMAAEKRAKELGYQPVVFPGPMSGLVEDAADIITKATQSAQPGTALIWGGEITVKVSGSGKGGRNQHLCLLMTGRIRNQQVVFGAAGTDGIDGNSPAAGAWTSGETLNSGGEDRFRRALKEFDSYRYFTESGQTIVTGPSGTNVMDLYIALV